MSGTVIVAGARTPIGRLLGGLKSFSAADLGGIAIKGALEKAGVTGEQVDYLIMGQVILAGAGQNPARAAGLAGGLPASVPSITVNKVCLSGLNAIATADQMIRAGEADIIVAGGMESMTNAPHLLPKSREGFKYGDTALVDSMAYDALFDQATQQAMGGLTEACNAATDKFTREEQDAFAAASHQKAAEAWKNGVFDDEVVPVSIPQRKGDPVVVSSDEGVRGDTTAESLGGLRPAFAKDGTITAGTSSQISDGASAVLLMDSDLAASLGLKPRARIVSHCLVGSDPYFHLDGPVDATQRILDRTGMSISDFDLFEVNEAFASVVLSWAGEHKVDMDKVNVNGGAIAIGHPVGSTGTRLITTALHELERRDASTALISMCAGGAMATGTVIERL
mgnify:CR=1 FL=1